MTKDKQRNQLHVLNHELGAAEEASCTLDGEGYCITCSDEAVQVRVLTVNEEDGFARVSLNGTEEEIDVTLVEHIAPGDILLVHGGVAIARVDEASNA
jgi:hydrogenase maturation factor